MSSPNKCLRGGSGGPEISNLNDGVPKGSASSQDDEDLECWADAEMQLSHENDHGYNAAEVNHLQTNRLDPSESSQIKLAHIEDDFDELILHKAIFHNDKRLALSLLKDTELLQRKDLINKKDKHGNTALHLACMLGRSEEIIGTFLGNNVVKWSIDVRNVNRWTPFHEACSYGDRDVITLMAKQIKDDVDDALHNQKLSNFLEKTKNYRLVLKWEFQSWVPLISRVLPSDVCVINKQGRYLRIDTRLLDFEGLFRKKGDSCLVYNNGKWIVINNKLKKYQFFEAPSVYKDIDEKVDEFMSMDIMDLELKSSEMQLTRSTSGWIWKADKFGKVGRSNAALFDLTNVYLVTRKRREHLSEEDLKRNKSAYKNAVYAFKFGEKPPPPPPRPLSPNREASVPRSEGKISPDVVDDMIDPQAPVSDGEEPRRESLAPPPPTQVTWTEYIQSEPPGNHPDLGRQQKLKTTKTAVKASVAMSEEFPLNKNEFLDLLSVVPIKMFKKLKDFVEMKLPEGFPVRLDIPVFPALTARITFEDFVFLENAVEESLFSIPRDYEQDSNLLPGRFRGASYENEEEDETNSD